MFSLSFKSSSVFLGCIIFLILIMNSPVCTDVVVVGYYTSWNKSVYPADKISFENLTHINHAFAWPEANGTISMYSTVPDLQLIEQTHLAGKKILISLGGWGNSAGFSPMSADTTARGIFIRTIVDFILAYEYDGIDFDWEFPSSTTDKNNLNFLIAELRQELDTIDTTLLITMAVPAANWSGQWFDFGTLKNDVDWFGVMTYDFHGNWSDHAGHNSPLYAPANDPCGSVHTGIQYLTVTRAVPKEKVLAGLPFYGREFDASQIYGPSAGSQNEYPYAEVVPKIGNGWTYLWDDLSKVPYMTNDTQVKLISYDNSISIRLKCEYARQKNLRGVMIWALGQDMIGENQNLLATVGKAMGLVTALEKVEINSPVRYLSLYNFPNPFNSSTVISYTLPSDARIDLTIYTITGEKVITLISEFQTEGNHQFEWETQNLVSGLYICRLQAGGLIRTEKFVLLK
jgi:chitinase